MTDHLNNPEVPVDGYSFSYIPKNEFESILKHVKRERRKKNDEKLWEQFLLKKQEKQMVTPSDETHKGIIPTKDNTNEVDDDNCRCVMAPVQMNQQNAAKKCTNCLCKDLSSTQHHQHQTQERQLPEPQQPKIDSAVQNLENHERLHDRTNLKTTSRDQNLYETTNFDEEFRRVKELRDKIVFALKSIETALRQEGCKNLDEDELVRNRVRTSEFAARFKRNYHYQITRQVNEIKKLISNESWKETNVPVAVKKFKSSHQVTVQGLQAIEKHLRTTCDNSPHPWLQDFLSSICEMEDMFCSVFECDKEEEQTAFRTLCSKIVVELHSITNKHKKEPEVKRKKKKPGVKRNETRDNLWMYRTHKDWKTKASELARVKLAKMNRKKNEASEQQPGESVLVPPVPDLKMEVKQREGASLRKHSRSMKEDQVRTMMEIVPEATDDSDHEEEKPEDSQSQQKPTSKAQDDQSQLAAKSIAVRSPTEVRAEFTNVAYICLSRPEEDTSNNSYGPSQTVAQMAKPDSKMAAQYRKALQSHQRKMKWYNPNVIGSIDRFTDQIYEDYLSCVASEINIDHIISNLIDLEMRS